MQNQRDNFFTQRFNYSNVLLSEQSIDQQVDLMKLYVEASRSKFICLCFFKIKISDFI